MNINAPRLRTDIIKPNLFSSPKMASRPKSLSISPSQPLLLPSREPTNYVLHSSSIHKYSIPPPHSTLVTLRTLSAPVNPSDVNQIQGVYPTVLPFTNALSTSEPSAVPGNEGCFEVIATGASVTTVAKGDWVIPRTPGLGTWRTHLQVDESSVMHVDYRGLMHTEVATVSINPVTAWRLLKDFVDLKEGDWFIHNGATGAVGQSVMQLAKLWGLKNIAIVKGPMNGNITQQLKSRLEEVGATKVFTEFESQASDFKEKVAKLTDGKGLRLGLNCVGGILFSKMATVLNPGAQLVTYGNMSRQPTRLSAGSMIFRDLIYRGFWVTRWSEAHPEEKEKTVREALELMRDHTLQVSMLNKVVWEWFTPKETLIHTIDETFNSNRKGKGMFVFEHDYS